MKLIIAIIAFFVAVNGQFTGNSTEDRSYTRFLTEGDKKELVQLKLYNRDYPKGLGIWPTDIELEFLELSLKPMKLFMHGYHSYGDKYETKDKLKMATKFLTYDENVNVILVTWNSRYEWYPNTADKSMDVGEFLAEWLIANICRPNANQLHLIGHSLGAQAVGKAGRIMTENGCSPMRVTGLDPAGPRFERLPGTVTQMIGTDSAQFVDIIHTNPAVLGIKQPRGHVDFYVDGGYQNVACYRNSPFIPNKRSHSYATILFIESILNPDNEVFKSSPCERVDPAEYVSFAPTCEPFPVHTRYTPNYLGMGARKSKRTDLPYTTELNRSYRTDLPRGYLC